MSTTNELVLLDENQRLKVRVAELEGQLGRKIVKSIVWAEETHHGRTAEQWCVSYEILRDAIFMHLGEFVFDDDCAEEAIFEDTIRQLGYALRNMQWDDEAGLVGDADFSQWGLAISKCGRPAPEVGE